MQGDSTSVLTALTLMGTSAHHPSLRGSGTGIRTVLTFSLQEKGYKNSLRAYVLLEYLHKACVQS